MTDSFFEIARPDGDVIQRIAVLGTREVEGLRAAGYLVRTRTLSRSLFDWLREDARAALEGG